MNTSHRWFRSGAYSILGHVDVPQTRYGRLGVVIVPPFGWEDACSYRSLRFLGRMLAANGIPALRFDLPGTGDSSGGARDSGLIDAWIQSVGDAATDLRAATCVEDVAVVGIRLGGMLAVAAAARGADFQDLVLWGAAATGRALLRELLAFRNMELPDHSNREPPPQPIPGFETVGFLMTPETQKALEAFNLSALPSMHGRRTLVLSRDNLAPDAKLVRMLEASGCKVQVGRGNGYAAMMTPSDEVVLPPAETARVVVEFLTSDRPKKRQDQASAIPAKVAVPKSPAAQPAVTVTEGAAAGVLETIYTLECSSASIFGILSEPGPEAPPNGWCVLFLNPGAVRHIGPNRMWVEAARRWAARGILSLRMDFQGIGESDGEQSLAVADLYHARCMAQIELAMDSLRHRAGIRRFAVVGLCSGAFWGFQAAIRHSDIRGAILLNPRLFFWDPEVDRRRTLRRVAKGFNNSAMWRRLASGEVQWERIRKVARIAVNKFRTARADVDGYFQIPPKAIAEARAAIECNQSRLTLIFTEDEPLLREMEEEGQLPPETNSRFRCIRIANGGHTLRPLWAQKLAHELIDRELDAVLREN